jgi:hypothetical protein
LEDPVATTTRKLEANCQTDLLLGALTEAAKERWSAHLELVALPPRGAGYLTKTMACVYLLRTAAMSPIYVMASGDKVAGMIQRSPRLHGSL